MTNINNFVHPLKRFERIADPEIRKQAIENFNPTYCNNIEGHDDGSIQAAIWFMCNWEHTTQKHDYWYKIWVSAFNNQLELLPESITEEYTLKSNEQLIDQISQFGDGTTEFHTRDIQRILNENEKLREFGAKVFNLYKQWCIDYPFVTDEFKELEKELEQLLKQKQNERT